MRYIEKQNMKERRPTKRSMFYLAFESAINPSQLSFAHHVTRSNRAKPLDFMKFREFRGCTIASEAQS